MAGLWRDRSWVMRQLAPCILPVGTNLGPHGICPLLFLQLASLPRAHPARKQAQLLAAPLPTSASRKGSGGWRSRGGVTGDCMRAPELLVEVLLRSWQPYPESCSVAEAAYGLLTEQLLGRRRRKEASRDKQRNPCHHVAPKAHCSMPSSWTLIFFQARRVVWGSCA